ncbi:MAG: coenzyme F420-0:L-glutamate ligase [Actinomycetota bacterium]|nr:coenzyme F420-0:L-glutamate ligase [Actinomycetota bacterium]
MSTPKITVFGLAFEGEVLPGDSIAERILASCRAAELTLEDDDIVVVTHKVVSKAEGRVAALDKWDGEARERLVLEESARIVRRREGLIIAQTKHGFICANAGVDSSNVEPGFVTLLPLDPDKSARRIRSQLRRSSGADVAVIITDTFGRPWRIGQVNVAIGVAGMLPLRNYRNAEDSFGQMLLVTNIAVADEIAGAAELVMGKSEGIPVAVVRGAKVPRGRGNARQLLRPSQEDLFL